MRFSDLNINLNLQVCSPTFQRNFESLTNWGSRTFQALQNHPYALHNHSPQAITGILLAINGLVFVAMRSFADAIESSLNKRFPTIPTTQLMISSTLIGGAVGALNLALFKLARLPASASLLYAISVTSVALHLILKPPTPSKATQIPFPSQPQPKPTSGKTSELTSKKTFSAPPPQHHPSPIQTEFPTIEQSPKSFLPQPHISPEHEEPPKPFPPQPNISPEYEEPPKPFQIEPPKRPPSADLLTPMPSKQIFNQPHTPTFSPIKNPNRPNTPTTPAAVPELNQKDFETVENEVLEQINQLNLKNTKMYALLGRYDALIQQFQKELKSTLKKHDGFSSNRLSASIAESQQGKEAAKLCIQDIDRELAKQTKILESIREKKSMAVPGELPSLSGTPAAKFRQQLLRSASTISQRLQEPPALAIRANFLEMNQSLNSPERSEDQTEHPLESCNDQSQSSSKASELLEPMSDGHITWVEEDEELDQEDVFEDDGYDYEDEDGNLYREITFHDGKCLLVSQNGDCFDRNGNHVGSLVNRTFG